MLYIPILCISTLPLLLHASPGHIRARNVAMMTLATVLFLTNLIQAVDMVKIYQLSYERS
jgi:hypothetical protein